MESKRTRIGMWRTLGGIATVVSLIFVITDGLFNNFNNNTPFTWSRTIQVQVFDPADADRALARLAPASPTNNVDSVTRINVRSVPATGTVNVGVTSIVLAAAWACLIGFCQFRISHAEHAEHTADAESLSELRRARHTIRRTEILLVASVAMLTGYQLFTGQTDQAFIAGGVNTVIVKVDSTLRIANGSSGTLTQLWRSTDSGRTEIRRVQDLIGTISGRFDTISRTLPTNTERIQTIIQSTRELRSCDDCRRLVDSTTRLLMVFDSTRSVLEAIRRDCLRVTGPDSTTMRPKPTDTLRMPKDS